MITKSYFTNTMDQIRRSYDTWADLGYSLEIPWNAVYSSGWQYGGNRFENARDELITRPDPEYYAPGNIIRSNVLPEINPSSEIYTFDRSKYTHRV